MTANSSLMGHFDGDGEDGVLHSDSKRVRSRIVGERLKLDAVALQLIVKAISGLVDVGESNGIAIIDVRLIGAVKVDGAMDLEVKGGGSVVDNGNGSHRLTKNSLGSLVCARRRSTREDLEITVDELGQRNDGLMGGCDNDRRALVGQDDGDRKDGVLDLGGDGVGGGIVNDGFKGDRVLLERFANTISRDVDVGESEDIVCQDVLLTVALNGDGSSEAELQMCGGHNGHGGVNCLTENGLCSLIGACRALKGEDLEVAFK